MIAGKTNTDRNMEGGSLATEKPLIRTAKEKGRQLLAVAPPNPEVQDKAVRRRFTAEYKLHILNLADSCTEAGSMGALLRREGLYASNLNTWRHQRDLGVLSGLTPKKRGRKELVRDPLVAENEKLLRENERITKRLRQAEIIIDVQKKVSQLLGIQLALPRGRRERLMEAAHREQRLGSNLHSSFKGFETGKAGEMTVVSCMVR